MNFDQLLPESIFETVQTQGWVATGALSPLNSYENRVYEIGIEAGDPIIGKYYRPARWSGEAIGEEHRFLNTLVEAEIPVVAPLPLKNPLPMVETLGQTGEIYYAFFKKFRGRERSEMSNEDRRWLGRLLGRLHNIGSRFKSEHRLRLTPQTYGSDSLAFILTQEFLPDDLKRSLENSLQEAIQLVEPRFNEGTKTIALHGDCHPGNILWNKEGPHLVDFDDMVVAPPVQDVWMLFNGTDEEKKEQQKIFFEGYEMFRAFDHNTLSLTEPLRTLRMIRHAAWIGQRYGEPAFQNAFPYYTQRRYWEGFLFEVKEQIALLRMTF